MYRYRKNYKITNINRLLKIEIIVILKMILIILKRFKSNNLHSTNNKNLNYIYIHF